jgi:hypothetical protein
MHILLPYKMLKFTLKYLIFVSTYFGPLGPSSGSLHSGWLKLHFCGIDQYRYIVIRFAVLWQHVFQVVVCVLSVYCVVCVLSAVQRARPHNTAKLITIYFYWLILQECNFSWAQRKLPEDGPGRPKHVGADIKHFNVNFNILCG